MNRKHIRVLLIEDNPGDARLIQEMLADGGGMVFACECVASLSAGLQRIAHGGIDVVLLDLGLPDSVGLDTLRRLRAGALRAPVVVVMSGLGDEEVAVQAVQEGAQDYLVKGQVDSSLLLRSLRYAIERDAAEAALQRAHDELENQVVERTATLANTIESLQKEIAERQRAEAALRESEERYRSLVEIAPEAIVVHSRGKIIYGNPAAMQLYGGQSLDDFVGKPVMDFVHPDHRPIVTDRIRKSVEQREPAERVEEKHVRLDGQVVCVEVTTAPINYMNEPAILLIITDITARQRAEAALRRLNRELRAISNCNQTLMRAVDEQTLLNDICRIVCDEAGYHMAWVGYAEHDDAKTVRPAAWAGNEAGYLANANITWADTERGRGTTGTAIRSGKSACIQDFTTDPQAAPWRENALQRGYRSSIALPLKDESAKTFGVLNIYSTEPNAFTLDEMRLLEELAGDLAFGIVVLRSRAERKRAEEALRESETKFRAVFENSVDAIGVSKAGIHTFVNPAYLALFGYADNAELTGKPIIDLIAPSHHAQVLENVRRRASGQAAPAVYETRGLRKDGSEFDMDVHMSTYELNGEIYLVPILRDITGRKQAEQNLRQMNEWFSLAARAARLGVWDWDIQKDELVWDDGMYELYGVKREYFAGAYEAWLKGIHPDDRAPSDEISQQARRGEREYDTEFRIVWPDGSLHYLKAYGQFVRDADGKPLRMTGINFDITERKRAEAEIQALAKFPSENPNPVLRITKEGLLLYANRASADLIQCWNCSVGDPLPDRWRALILEVLDAGLPREEETVCGERVFSLTLAPFAESGYVNLYGRDITERKRAEGEIHRLNQELEQRVLDRTAQLEAANKELDAFAFSVSHDLRAPLRHIDGFIEMLQKRVKTTLDDQSQHYMEVIADSATKMGTLIDDLLSFSRMGRTEMFKSKVDLDELVQDIVHEFWPEAEGRDIEWQISPLPLITGDQAMLRVALVNLISNALKFTRPRKIAQIEIGCKIKNETEVIIFVRDNGVGFDIKYVDKLFGVFQRLHRADEFEGTGIGLANVRRIINRHGGKTWAEGETDHGATFYFSLPKFKKET